MRQKLCGGAVDGIRVDLESGLRASRVIFSATESGHPLGFVTVSV
ncbi:MAG: hypothetical protein U0T81_15545 [Saprospiraceae bacterium]